MKLRRRPVYGPERILRDFVAYQICYSIGCNGWSAIGFPSRMSYARCCEFQIAHLIVMDQKVLA